MLGYIYGTPPIHGVTVYLHTIFGPRFAYTIFGLIIAILSLHTIFCSRFAYDFLPEICIRFVARDLHTCPGLVAWHRASHGKPTFGVHGHDLSHNINDPA